MNSLKKYFLAQTRHHMGQALETGDRLIDFLWANLILGTFFALEGRTNDAYLTVSSCVEFALACGLDVVHYRHTGPLAQDPLLPPPTDKTEAIERMKLSFAIYILDRTLAMIDGTPSAFAGDNGPLTRRGAGIEEKVSPSVTSEVRRIPCLFMQSYSSCKAPTTVPCAFFSQLARLFNKKWRPFFRKDQCTFHSRSSSSMRGSNNWFVGQNVGLRIVPTNSITCRFRLTLQFFHLFFPVGNLFQSSRPPNWIHSSQYTQKRWTRLEPLSHHYWTPGALMRQKL